jgi:hypothetical protein
MHHVGFVTRKNRDAQSTKHNTQAGTHKCPPLRPVIHQLNSLRKVRVLLAIFSKSGWQSTLSRVVKYTVSNHAQTPISCYSPYNPQCPILHCISPVLAAQHSNPRNMGTATNLQDHKSECYNLQTEHATVLHITQDIKLRIKISKTG